MWPWTFFFPSAPLKMSILILQIGVIILSVLTFFLTKKSNPETIEARLPQFVQKNLDPYLIQRYQKSYAEMYQNGNQYGLLLMPLKDVHLSTMLFENREGKRTLTYALVAIGLIIIVMVSIME